MSGLSRDLQALETTKVNHLVQSTLAQKLNFLVNCLEHYHLVSL